MTSAVEISERTVDLAIVGSGPGGLSAAAAAAAFGLRAVMFDEQGAPGGQIFRRSPSVKTAELPSYARNLSAAYADPGLLGVEYRPGSCVWSFSDGNQLLVAQEKGTQAYRAQQVILSAGANEWIAPVKGWMLPGVITAGGAQALLKGSGVLPGRRLVIAGTGPLLLQLAVQLSAAGAYIAGVFEIASRMDRIKSALKVAGHPSTGAQGISLIATLARRGIFVQSGWLVREIYGEDNVTGIRLGDAGGTKEIVIEADAVCLHHGLVPSTQLAALRGCKIAYDGAAGTWSLVRDELMRTSTPSVFAVGDGARVGGARIAVAEGKIAGLQAAITAGVLTGKAAALEMATAQRALRRLAPARRFLEYIFRPRDELLRNIADDVIVCRCENVTAGAIRAAARSGTSELHELRTLLRPGMGNCQGRTCATTVLRLLSSVSARAPEEIGPPRPRAPICPLSIQEMSFHA